MAMNPGNKEASAGLAKVIYDAEQAHKERIEAVAPFDPANESGEEYKERVLKALDDSSRERAFDIADAIIQHFKSNAEIKGVTTNLDVAATGRTIETYVTGIGDKGGALAAGVNPVVGSVRTDKDTTATQNNSGTIE